MLIGKNGKRIKIASKLLGQRIKIECEDKETDNLWMNRMRTLPNISKLLKISSRALRLFMC